MIYLDNAATTFPKPESVINAMVELMQNYGGNPGRGGHFLSRKSGEKIYECRELLARFINAKSPDEIIFTKNATEAINLAIKGCVKKGDEIIISSMEHNSTLRSAVSMEKDGVSVKIARCNSDGLLEPENIIPLITKKTKLICIIHASNVVGTVNPVESICQEARSHGVLTLIDAAQSAGILDINAGCADMIAFAGHKGLYGPFGTGALYLRQGIKLDTLTEGGTGSFSESALMPDISPDRYEAGTLNACGISGLCEGIKFVQKEGCGEKELELGRFLKEQVSAVKGVRIIGDSGTGVIGLRCIHKDCVDVATQLDREYNIASRAGLHCAPMAHRTLGTVSQGLLRLSVGFFNTKDEITQTVSILDKITQN